MGEVENETGAEGNDVEKPEGEEGADTSTESNTPEAPAE